MAFIDAHRDRFGVEPMCRVLTQHGVAIAPSTYYGAKTRPPSARERRDEQFLVEIRRAHLEVGRGLYGARKVWHHLRREGIEVARCTVERLMRTDGLRGARRGRRVVTTKSDPGAIRPPDLVQRAFRASRPNQLWVVDFTYVATWSGMAFTAFVSDVFSRRIVGSRTAASMPTELPLDALEMALWTRARGGEPVNGLVHHSDAGTQYTSIRYPRLADAGAVASIGSVGDSFDNAMAESVIGLFKTELHRNPAALAANGGHWRGLDDLEIATCGWVSWFNQERFHGELGDLTPAEVEAAYYLQQSQPDAA